MAEGEGETTCQELVELVTDHLEGALSPSVHGSTPSWRRCPRCTLYPEQMRTTIDLVGRLPVDSIARRRAKRPPDLARPLTRGQRAERAQVCGSP